MNFTENGSSSHYNSSVLDDSNSSDSEDEGPVELSFVDDDGQTASVVREVDHQSLTYGRRQFSGLPEASNQEQSQPIHSRILKDVFHLMQMIRVSRKHGLSKPFARDFRDALFVIDESDKENVKSVLEKQGQTWHEKLVKNPDWVFRRVKRT